MTKRRQSQRIQMKKVYGTRSSMRRSFVGALGSLLTISPLVATERPTINRPNITALRGDMTKLGNDMKIVIEREKASR